MYWSYLLTSVGVAGLFLVGRKKRVGWIISMSAQVLWVTYAITTKQYGFLASAAAYGTVQYLGFRNFNKKKKGVDPVVVEHSRGYIAGLTAAAETVNRYGESDGLVKVVTAIAVEKKLLRAAEDVHE